MLLLPPPLLCLCRRPCWLALLPLLRCLLLVPLLACLLPAVAAAPSLLGGGAVAGCCFARLFASAVAAVLLLFLPAFWLCCGGGRWGVGEKGTFPRFLLSCRCALSTGSGAKASNTLTLGAPGIFRAYSPRLNAVSLPECRSTAKPQRLEVNLLRSAAA